MRPKPFSWHGECLVTPDADRQVLNERSTTPGYFADLIRCIGTSSVRLRFLARAS
jgi:hypothetical protein